MWEVQNTLGAELFVRVLYEGTVVPDFEWIPFESFVQLLEDNVPTDLTEACS